MQDTKSFGPLYIRYNPTGPVQSGFAPSVTVATNQSTATASTTIPGAGPGFNQLQIANTTSAWAYVNVGVLLGGRTVTPATVAASYPVAPGAVVVISVHSEVNAVSVISDAAPSASTSVIITRGEGI